MQIYVEHFVNEFPTFFENLPRCA